MMRGDFTGEKEDNCERERVNAEGGSLESVGVCDDEAHMCKCECGEQEDLQWAVCLAVGQFVLVVKLIIVVCLQNLWGVDRNGR
jgi:hypothetical protein